MDDENEGFLEDLEKRIRELSCGFKNYSKIKLKPMDLELIKPNSNGRYKNVYAKIYTKAGKPKIPISERIKVEGEFRRRRIDINELVDELFEGTCVIRIYRVYVGSSKSVTLSVEEILAMENERKSSYFEEYSEEGH